MSRLLVCYEQDAPSANMKKQLLSKREWEDIGTDGTNQYLQCGDLVLMTIDRMHVRADGIDRAAEDFGVKVDDMIVLSRHSSASGKPTLTVHPIGNYTEDNSMGGRPCSLVKAMPHMMTAALRVIERINDTDYDVSFEVTHHGPYVDVPTMYIEIGSDEKHWNDMHAADILVNAILHAEEKDNPVIVGIGGGHYAPRFTDLALESEVDVGHMIPNYRLQGADDEQVSRMIRDAAEASGTDYIYVHRNSMKGPEEKRLNRIINALGYNRVSSKDFELI